MALVERLRVLLGLREGDIGLLRDEREVRARAERLPRISCAEARDGARGRFDGVVLALEEPFAAPVSGAPCVAVNVRSWSQASGGGFLPVNLGKAVDFLVDDGTGVARVSTTLLSWFGPEQAEAWADEVFGDYDAFAAWVRRRQAEGTSLGRRFGAPWSHRESTLAAGDRVTVVGGARREPAPAGGALSYRTSSTRAVIEPALDAVFLYAIPARE